MVLAVLLIIFLESGQPSIWPPLLYLLPMTMAHSHSFIVAKSLGYILWIMRVIRIHREDVFWWVSGLRGKF